MEIVQVGQVTGLKLNKRLGLVTMWSEIIDMGEKMNMQLLIIFFSSG